jgi:hypothetical protein
MDIRSTGGLINDVEKEYTGGAVILKHLERFTFLDGGPRDLEVFDAAELESFRNFFH